jgi:8-oxo-dGTP pyrophosphatase MutT (NUDIX family)
VVFRRSPAGPRFLLILDRNGNWGFPKGHLDGRETPLDAACREVAEETGLGNLVLHGDLDVVDWYFRARGTLVHKHCHLFLLESAAGDLTPQLDEGITACEWYGLDEALGVITFDNSRKVLRAAGERVRALDSQPETARES